jgi:hypothetical protein
MDPEIKNTAGNRTMNEAEPATGLAFIVQGENHYPFFA